MAAATQRATSVFICFGVFACILLATHFRLLDLPYFWDELGQFIPQTYDMATKSLLVPESTSPNSHPPGLPLLIAGLWKITGISIPATRTFMLLLAAAFATASFLLAIELLRGSRGFPAFLSLAFLLACPVFYMQAMAVQLDLPAALFSTILLLAYTNGQQRLALAAATIAVVFKETTLAIPLTLAWFAWRDGKRQFAVLLAALPILLLANYFAFTWLRTGHLFGDGEYTRFNLFYPLHPARLAFALFRRVSWLFVENFHFIPAAVLMLRWREIGFSPVWRPLAAACLAHSLLVSVTGGAVLERYLLPVLPVLYAAFAAGLSTLVPRWRHGLFGVALAGLFAALFWNPQWPYPLENNLAMVDLVEIHRNAAGLAESRFGNRRVTTAWPLSDALVKPYLGYVERAHPNVRKLPDFELERLKGLDWESGDILILYSRTWRPATSLSRTLGIREFAQKYLPSADDATREDLRDLRPLRPLIGYEQRGLWVEILIVP
jgi:hypothetical protein